MSYSSDSRSTKSALPEPIIAPGTLFQGRYELLDMIGEGGFSRVYKARQRATGQQVAVKLLRPFLATTPKHMARFQRELQLCAQLYHPNIVRLLDSGRTDEEQIFLVFELVPGRTLSQILAEEGALEPREALHLMMQVLDALGCAHAGGIIHRDLKPLNIMVTSTGARRNAQILDFGMGTLLEDEAQERVRSTLTSPQELIGTPAYAAPEQLRGEAPSPRSDLYTWGLIFLECLTGRRLIDGKTLQEVLSKQLDQSPIPIPEALEGQRLGRLLQRVTAREVTERDITASGLLRELEACSLDWSTLARLGAVARTAPHAETPSHNPTSSEGERRQLTVLCYELQLTGATADIEERDELLRSQHELCAEVAERFDAHVGSLLGTRALLCFGYPMARGDDARRAAQAALCLTREIRQRSARLEATRGLRLELRVGIHTGLFTHRRPRRGLRSELLTASGTTPEAAARLMALASPGHILLSEDTHRLLRGLFTLEPLAGRYLEEAGRPLALFLLHDQLPSTPLPSSSPAEPLRPLIGRERELGLVLERWEQACQGNGQCILLVGEPGVGKSRLSRELVWRLQDTPHLLLESRCLPESQASTLAPFIDMLERLLGHESNGGAEQVVQDLEALLARHGFETAELMPLLTQLLSLPTPSRHLPPDLSTLRHKELTLNALLNLLFALSEQQPVLLLIEDLQWADPTSLELLSLLVNDAPTSRLCALFTARPELTPPWPHAQVLQIQLPRLERSEVEQIVAALAPGLAQRRELIEQVVQHADGVPLFAEELALMLAERQSAAGATDRAAPLLPLEPAVPTTLRDLLMARLDRLGRAKETAQLAAALGREFSSEQLGAISPLEEKELQQDLSALVEADIVYRRRAPKAPVYVFRHALLRDMAYESMLKPMRVRAHALIASVLEQRFPELVASRPELLVHHHHASGKRLKALEFAERAALAAHQRSSSSEALHHATQALQWLEALPTQRERALAELRLQGLITAALQASGDLANQELAARVARSQELLDTLGDDPHTLRALWALMGYHHSHSHRDQARSLAERLLAVAEQTADAIARVAALSALGTCLMVEGQLAKARSLLEQAMALYAPQHHGGLAHVYGTDPRVLAEFALGQTLWLMGYPEQALAHMEAALAWAREIQHGRSQVSARIWLMTVHQQLGDVERLRAAAAADAESIESTGLPLHRLWYRHLQAWAARDVAQARESLTALVRTGSRLGLSYVASMLIDTELALGQRREALACAERVLEQVRQSGEGYFLAELLRLRAACLQEEDPRAAEAGFQEALDTARKQGARALELRALHSLCLLLRQQGRSAEARERLAALLGSFSEGQGTRDLAQARALLEALGSEAPA